MQILTIEEAIGDLNSWGGHKWVFDLIEANNDTLQRLTISMKCIEEISRGLAPDKDGDLEGYCVNAARQRIASILEILPDSLMISDMFLRFDMINTLLLAIGTHMRDQERGDSNKPIPENHENRAEN